jgi:predicted RNase H-like nuclease (RuvC/YqgF family)
MRVMKTLPLVLIAVAVGALGGAAGMWWFGDRGPTARLQQDLEQSRQEIGSLQQRLDEAGRRAAAAEQRGDRLQAAVDQQAEVIQRTTQTQRQRLQQELERAKARATDLEQELAALESSASGDKAGTQSGHAPTAVEPADQPGTTTP